MLLSSDSFRGEISGVVAISGVSEASLSRREMVHNHSYENEFKMMSFSYERLGAKYSL